MLENWIKYLIYIKFTCEIGLVIPKGLQTNKNIIFYILVYDGLVGAMVLSITVVNVLSISFPGSGKKSLEAFLSQGVMV